jgi:catechol 2,3-dioxygenase-like lactoylglutathione lyase family enzyme
VRVTLLTHHTALVHKLEAADKEMPMADEFPTDGMELTHILVVEDVDRSRAFYRDALGAEVYREYGGSSVVLRFLESWLLIVTGGGPTADKPGVVFAPPEDRNTVSHSMTIRVPDCRSSYDVLKSRGVTFLTPPVGSDWEIRCFFRDPDGHLLEISQAK